MRQLNVAIIGTGMAFERLHYPAYQELTREYKIVALADPDEFKLKEWAVKLGITPDRTTKDYHQILYDPAIDVFDIMVPIESNFQITEEVAQAIAGRGKGIICEKPLAPNEEQAEAARDLPRKYNVPIVIAENYRYNEDPNIIRNLVNSGRIGEVYYFVWNRVMNFPKDMVQNQFAAKEWRQHPRYPGGVFTDTAVHDIAALQHIFGWISKVQAWGQRKEVALGQYAVVNANLQFSSGFTGQYTFFCGGQEAQRPLTGLRIFGDLGMVYHEERDCGVINLSLNNGPAEQIPYRPQRGYYNELLNFYKVMNGIEAIAVPPELEFKDAQVIFALLRSMAEETIIPIEPSDIYLIHRDPGNSEQGRVYS